MQVNDLTRRQLDVGLQPEVITATPLPADAGPPFPVPVHRYGIPIPAEIANNPMPSRPIEKALRRGQFRRRARARRRRVAVRGGRCADRPEMGLPVTVTVHCLPAAFRLPSWLIPWSTPESPAGSP